MFTYWIIQLGRSFASSVALMAIAISFCSLTKEAKVFNEYLEEVQASGKSSSNAVHFCNGVKEQR